jgi:hypothetical protein
MHKKTEKLIAEIKANPNEAIVDIAKRLKVKAHALYQIKHRYMKDNEGAQPKLFNIPMGEGKTSTFELPPMFTGFHGDGDLTAHEHSIGFIPKHVDELQETVWELQDKNDELKQEIARLHVIITYLEGRTK